VAGLVNKKILAPMVFKGTCTTLFFEAWVEQFLIPELIPGQIVVLDNATFHKSNRTKELIESAGCTLLFLPPYSPDFNPIEQFWARMKKWIRQKISHFDDLKSAIDAFFNLC
jgi:transposase